MLTCRFKNYNLPVHKMELDAFHCAPFVDLSGKRPSHSVSLTNEISSSLESVSTISEADKATCSHMSCASLVDANDNEVQLLGNSVNVNFSPPANVKNESLPRIANMYRYARRPRQRVPYALNQSSVTRVMWSGSAVLPSGQGYVPSRNNRPLYVSSASRFTHRLNTTVCSAPQMQTWINGVRNSSLPVGRGWRYIAPYPCFRMFFRKSGITNPKIFWLKMFDLCFYMKTPLQRRNC